MQKNKKHFPKVAGRNKNDHNRYKESRFHGFIYGALVLNFKSKYYLNCYAERSSGRGGGADLVLISRKDEYKNRNLGAVPVIVELKVDQSASTTDVKKEVESNIFSNVRTFSDEAIVACASLWIEKSKTRLGESELIAKRYNIPKVEGLITLLLENLNDSDLDNIIKEELERLHHSIPSMGKINGNPNYLSRLILGEILTNNDKLRKFAFIYKDKEKFTTFLLQRDGVDQIIILNVVESVLIKLEKTVTFNDKVVISDSGYIYQIDIGINPEQTKKFFDEKSSTEKYLQLLQIRKWNFQEYKNEQKYNGELIEFGSVNYVNLNKEVELKVIEDEQLTNNLNEALFPIRELITLVDGNQDWSKISKNKAGNIDKTTKSNLMAVIHGLFIGKQNIAKKSNQIIKVLAKTSLAYKRDLDLAISIASKDRNTYQENEVVAICTSEPDTFIERGLRSLIQKMRAKVQVVSFNVKANSKNDLINIKSKNYDIEHTSIGEEDIIEDFFDAIYEGKVNELVDLLKNRVTSERIKLRKREYNDAFKLTLELEEFEMSDLLLKYAIDDKQKHLMLNGADKNGITLLDNAAENDKWNIVEYLINKGGESDYVLEPYMFRLIEEQKWEKVKFLIDKEVDVNATDGKDMTPLHHAVRDNNAKMVSFLIDKGADVDAEDKGKNTPLHYACRDGNYDIVYLLLDRDAKSISNEDGKEPDYYLDYDNPESEQIRELFEERFSNSDSQNPSSDEESHAPEEYHSSSDEIDSDDSQAYFEHLFNKEPDPDSDLTPSSSDELDIEYDSVRCLSSDSGRKKREAESECLFTWEDVDEFNEEKDKKRDLSKIKIDSERFVSYIKDLPEGKQSQLIQLAGETGNAQGLVSKLISNQKIMNHLSRVGRVSGMTMHGMMAKNVLADFLNSNYQGVAINVGFIAGGQGFAKVAEAASLKGLKLAEEGKLLVGQSLKAASPFLARGTSAFVVYDLVNQIKAFKNGTEEALVGVVGDSIYLGVDAAEIGVEVAEAFGVLEGVSSVTGPIGATIGAVVFVGTDIYMAVKRVDKIDQIIHLTGDEKFVEGLRAFIGMKPEQYIEELMEKKQLYNQLVKQGLGYLKQHSDIQSYVFPTTDKLDSKVLLDRKRTGIRWSRARPDDLNEGRVFCLPQGNDEPAPDYGSYLCENAIGIFANKTGDHTLINLGEGKDYAKGFLNSPNIFVVNNGSKEYYGGNKDDIFVLQAEYIKGHLSGEGGINTLDTTLFALQEEQLNIQLEIGEIADYFRDNWLKICEINKVIGRANKAETITVSCDGCNSNVRLIDGQSGNEEIKDRINIIDDSCDYQMQIVVRPNTAVYNRALKGSFDYLVPLNSSGSAEVSFIYGPERFNVNNTFWFAYQAVDIKSIDVKYINVFNRTEHEVKFNFVESNKEFNVTISYSENPAYRLGKSGEIRIGNKGNLYMLESSDKSSEEVIRDYLPVANRVSKMSFFIQSVLSNETVVIGSGNHEVIHSNPAYRSHLVGNGGENVYVIDSETTEVIIHDVDEENSIDTIDLRNVVRQVRGELSNQDNFQLKVLKSANDLLLEATVVEVKPTEDSSVSKMRKHEYCTVRLKDGVNWYNKTHVIVDNAPMKINLDNNEWSLKPQPLMFERDKEIIVVTNQDIEQGSEIITPRKGGNYKFVRSNDNDLMITNAFDLTITKNDLCTITLSKFYETPRMKTLFIKFADKEIILKEHQEEISTARDVNVVKKEHKDQVYNDVFNPEVMMLSDQPVTHRHRHSRHREQARHRRSTTSSSTRPTGWINDLFGWVKSSISGLLSSKPESTKSPISQVDARVDVNGTIMLLDVLVRKFTGKQYIFAVDQSIPLLEARSYALNITNRFEKVLNKTAIKSGISLTNLNFDPVVVQSAIIGKIINGKFSEIAKTLYSFAKEACPEFKQTDKFLDHLKSSLKEEKETVMLQQKVEKPSKDLSQEVSRKVELSKKPNTFLNGTSVVRGISRAIN
ncbi:ankyrin repeat domain protein [Wolbachia endosymbiont of Culex quinquefasciatus JHB]|uniref:ankyrin repeat domain-containing protein n=2 Tax=unclassified Wolbachia TaxID=2640676 RepID=UPI000184915D|nr:ankyrin repeat domain-containing protein [Wolbachia endosymbiont of Culex quinquefasciatus]EEB55464.1 ankyrin repeat domain protein [Wolbachia endosymbiont of Culex quinquefasciatus JHB]